MMAHNVDDENREPLSMDHCTTKVRLVFVPYQDDSDKGRRMFLQQTGAKHPNQLSGSVVLR